MTTKTQKEVQLPTLSEEHICKECRGIIYSYIKLGSIINSISKLSKKENHFLKQLFTFKQIRILKLNFIEYKLLIDDDLFIKQLKYSLAFCSGIDLDTRMDKPLQV